jgi:phosphate transport system protein
MTATAGGGHYRGHMRDTYHEELDAISDALVEMASQVGSAMSRATTALLDADLALAEGVISADAAVDELYRSTEERAFDVMARQQPVASDLRMLVTSLRMVADLERMGDNAVHVAKIARRRYPSSAVPPQLRATVLKMGHVAEEIVAKAAEVVARRDIALAAELERDDDVMDDLHKRLFQQILESADGDVEAAIDVTLAGRYYERFADHAVSVARRVVYLVTGELPVPTTT